MSRLDSIMRAGVKPAQPGLISQAASPQDVRTALLKAAGMVAPEHPSLRWQVNGALLAHRRADDGVTGCGRTGELEVATDVGVPPCPKCFPS